MLPALQRRDPDERLDGAVAGAGAHVEQLAQSLQYEAAALVGERIPLITPIGEAYVAGAATEVAERWLAKVSPRDEELLGSPPPVWPLSPATASPCRSWASVSSTSTTRSARPCGSTARVNLTPAREREFRQLLAQTRCFFAAAGVQREPARTAGRGVLQGYRDW